MITRETKEMILQEADIVAIVGETVRLRREGTKQKGCCPFHNERTPSFFVYPHTNTFKCYGCGVQGNVIDFVMRRDHLDFPEAVKDVARRTGITVEEREETPEEKAERMKRETLQIYNRQVADFYRQEFLKTKEAQDYAYGRWGKEYCDRIGIGYAPKGGHALEQLPLKRELLLELGLLNRHGYDFFQDRITINICDRFANVIGFTARVMGDSQPKYLNSTESDIYHKSRSIFGIETAWNTVCKTGKAYLVEGGPDCMRLHSIGVENTVACLGSEWTREHLATLKKGANLLCFVPDDDPPKDGAAFGHGIHNVFKAGKLALEMGFSVSVKEIPDTDHKHKQDPDSYFTSLNIFHATDEEEFILWYARKHFPTIRTNDDKSRVVGEVARMLALIEDPTRTSIYIDSLTKFHKGKTFWRQAIDNERRKVEEESALQREKKETDMHRQFGFYVEHGKYYSLTEKGSVYEWSNFTLRPLFHILDNIMPRRLYMIKNELGQEQLIELKQEDLVSLQKFRLKVEGLGNFIWKATEKELTKLKGFLYSQTETAQMITQLGWQRKGFYAFGNGIVHEGQWMKTDDFGIVHLGEKGNFYLPAASKIYRDETRMYDFERRFVHLNLSSVTLREFTDQFFLVFGDNARVGFAFLLATLFHDIVTTTTSTGWFPILNLFGPKGSGKTDMGKTLMRFFVLQEKAPNVRNSTVPALNDTIAAVANALVLLDEYKNSLDIQKIEFLKGLWDCTGRTRMNMDLDKRKETTAVDAGVILAGQEMATMDIALFSRLIFLQFPRSEFSPEEKENYKRLEALRDGGLTHLTLEILQLRPKMVASYANLFNQVIEELTDSMDGMPIEDRILKNWAVPLAAYRCLETSLGIRLPYSTLYAIAVRGIQTQNAECKSSSELGNFWNMMQYLVAQGDVIEGGDFRIKYLSNFKSDKVSGTQYPVAHPILFLQKSRVFKLYRQSGRNMGDNVLPEESLKYYLEHSKAFLGEKNVRYDVYSKGMPVMTKSGDGRTNIPETTVQRSYCFDYALLREQFEVNFERATPDTLADEEKEHQNHQQDDPQQVLPF